MHAEDDACEDDVGQIEERTQRDRDPQKQCQIQRHRREGRDPSNELPGRSETTQQGELSAAFEPRLALVVDAILAEAYPGHETPHERVVLPKSENLADRSS